MKLIWLNLGGEAAKYQLKKIKETLASFKDQVVVLEVGSAYGGAVEAIAKLSKRIEVYGYDTFEGHPKDLAEDPKSQEAVCMDYWYRSDVFGTNGLDYEYQKKVLESEGVKNAHLVKGRVSANSFDKLDKIHFAMVDLDLVAPTAVVYEAIKDKIVSGGFLMFHDYADNHLPLLLKFIDDVVIPSGLWEVDAHKDDAFILLKKK